jgi:hypothetical protein
MFYNKTKVKFKFFLPNGRCLVTQGPVSPDPGRDDDPARSPGEPGRTPDDGSGAALAVLPQMDPPATMSWSYPRPLGTG